MTSLRHCVSPDDLDISLAIPVKIIQQAQINKDLNDKKRHQWQKEQDEIQENEGLIRKIKLQKFSISEGLTNRFEEQVKNGEFIEKISGKLEKLQEGLYEENGISKDGLGIERIEGPSAK